MSARLPAHIEVAGLLRQVQNAGGFAMVLAKGEPESGSLLVICCHNGGKARAYERMPDYAAGAAGGRVWQLARHDQDGRNPPLSEWLTRRQEQDPDLWIIELDIVDGERFIGLSGCS